MAVQQYNVRQAGTLTWIGPYWFTSRASSIVLTRNGEELVIESLDLLQPGSRAVQVGDVISVAGMNVGR